MPDAPVPIRKVDHVGIAVPSIAEALPLWAEALGGRFISGGDNEVTGLRIVHLRVADFKVELLAPLRADSMIGRHLERRGPGFHHMTFFVDDLPKTVHDLSGAGFEMTGTDLSSPVWSESFMSPRSASGTLLQFVETSADWTAGSTEFTLDDVLDGRVVWRDLVPCLRDPGSSRPRG